MPEIRDQWRDVRDRRKGLPANAGALDEGVARAFAALEGVAELTEDHWRQSIT